MIKNNKQRFLLNKKKIDKTTLFKRKLILNRSLKDIYLLKNLNIHPLGGEAKTKITNLETRLDTILLRMKLAKTIKSARQLIAHGLIEVNKKIIKSSKFEVLPMSTIHLIGESPLITSNNDKRKKPVDFTTVDFDTRSGIFIRRPTFFEIPLHNKFI